MRCLCVALPIGCGGGPAIEGAESSSGAATGEGSVSEPTSAASTWGEPSSTGGGSSTGGSTWGEASTSATSTGGSTGGESTSTGGESTSTSGESGSTGGESGTESGSTGGESGTESGSTGGESDTGGAGDSWLIRVAAGSEFDDARAVALGAAGALMIAGYDDGAPGESLYFGDDGDPGRIERTCNGAPAGFLSQHHGDGTIAWTEAVTSDAAALTLGVTAVEGGVVVLGVFQGTALFGAGQVGEIELVSEGKQDVYLARYDLAGALLWAIQIGGPDNEQAHAITTLGDGSLAVVGYYEDQAVFGVGAGAVTKSCQGLADAFIARYSPDGELLWVRDAGGVGIQETLGAAATADGGVVVTGEFQADVVFDRDGPDELTLWSAGDNDMFAARFAADGSRAWAVRAGGPDEFPAGFGDSGTQIATLTDGGVLICGEYNGPGTVFGPGEAQETVLGADADWVSRKLFLARYAAATGELEWVRTTATGTVDGTSGWHTCSQILPRPGGAFIVLGAFYASVIFGPGEASETELVSAGGFDVMLAGFTAKGELKWARRSGGLDDDHAGGLVQADDEVVIVGSLRGSAQFALSDDFQGQLISSGLSDAFALRIKP